MATALGNPTPLPTPAERPQADVVIYDGNCRICTGQMQRLARWDGRGQLSYLSLHDPAVTVRYPDLEHEDLMRNMVIVDGLGQRHRGADAAVHLARTMPSLWWLAPLRLPGTRWLWRWLYGHVARRRYLFGRTAAQCTDGACAWRDPD